MDNPFRHFEARFGLVRTSGDHEKPGVHAAGSYHYKPALWGGVEAYDYGDAVNPRARLLLAGGLIVALAKVGKGYRGVAIREAFYGKVPLVVKDGRVYTWKAFDPQGTLRAEHQNHLHLALSR